jgi:1-acyl-sn-glycerol-3-phosphate acyltransferase
MTQDASSTTTSGQHDEQGQQQQKPAVRERPGKSTKPEKNLYEPYDTPSILWHAIRLLARFIFAIVLHVRVRGRQNLPAKGPYILASNHLSWTDVPLVPAYLPYKVVSMAKEEAFHGKAGWLVRFMAAFPVKRGEGDRQAFRAADEQLKKGKVLMMFPEGTRSKTHTMAKGHAGLGMIALRSGVPVLPVAVWGSEYALKKFLPPLTISYGEPMILKPKGKKMTREDIDEGTEQVMRKIASMLPPEYRGVYGTESSSAEDVVEGSPETLQ